MSFAIVQHKMIGLGLGAGMIGSHRFGISLHVPCFTLQLIFYKKE